MAALVQHQRRGSELRSTAPEKTIQTPHLSLVHNAQRRTLLGSSNAHKFDSTRACSQFEDPAMAGTPSSNPDNFEPLDDPQRASLDIEVTLSSRIKANLTGNHVDEDQAMADAPSDPSMPSNPSTSESVCYQQRPSSNREGHPLETQLTPANPSNKINSAAQRTPQRMNWNIL